SGGSRICWSCSRASRIRVASGDSPGRTPRERERAMNRFSSTPTMFLVAVVVASASCTAQGPEEHAGAAEDEPARTAEETAPAPLESVRNFQIVDDRLASAGQIAYDQVPLIRERGYEVVINLAVADEERNGREGFHVAEEGLTYVHIPVEWTAPRTSDVRMFFDVMEAYQARRVFVHCEANMRA